MADLNERDAKLVQYLNEAYGKEKELETSLQAHIGMTTRPPYKKRLQQHLRETKGHARELERRIKKLGGDVATTTAVGQSVASRAVAAAKGPLHMVRGTGEEEKLLKNAKTEYSEEAEEIATYTAIEALADSVGDRETAKVARSIRRDEERMSNYLERLIPQLTRSVAQAEVPADQRRNGRRRTTRRRGSGTKRASGSKRASATKRASASKRRQSGTRRKATASSRRSGASRRRATSSGTRRRRSGSRSS
jgi:ferritin-like metal-binding protein YciE